MMKRFSKIFRYLLPALLIAVMLLPTTIFINPQLVHATAIDIGSAAINRGGTFTNSYTLVEKDNTANADGLITSIEIWANTDISGLRVGTFYVVAGNTLKCRDSEAIAGVITAGSKVTKSDLSITVTTGDYLGCYYTGGQIELDTSGAGQWFYDGECIDPDDSAAFTFEDSRSWSLYGTGGPVLPTVSIDAASDITETTMTLNGSLDSLGEEDTVDVRFEYGEETGVYTGNTTYVEMDTAEAIVGVEIDELEAGTTYYFRVDCLYQTDQHAYSSEDNDDTTHIIGTTEWSARIAANADDAEVYGGSNLAISQSVNAAGNYGGNALQGSGMRWTDVTIAQGATIDSAYITFVSYDNMSGATVKTKFYGEDADTSVAFTTYANWAGRSRTTASVTWDAIAPWTTDIQYVSPDLKTIVQEIVDRALWVSGNDMTFFWGDEDGRSSANAIRDAISYDEDPTKAPVLTINYESDAAAVNTNTQTNIGETYVTLNGELIDLNGHTIIKTGFKYGTTITMDSDIDSEGSFSTGTFSNTVTGLTANTLYYFQARVYASDESVWYTGAMSSFTTTPSGGVAGTWTAYDSSNPVMSEALASGFGAATSSASVVYINDEYVMFFEYAPSPPDYYAPYIGRATSANGINWAYTGTCLSAGGVGTYDHNGVWDPSVAVDPDGETLWMVYGSFDPTRVPKYCVASSDDYGVTWTKYGSNPISAGQQDPNLFYDSENERWMLYEPGTNGTGYYSYGASPESLGSRTAFSISGVGGFFQPDVHYYEDQYVMFYGIWTGNTATANSVGMATSSDGITWTVFTSVVWSNGNDANVIQITSTLYYMYHGRSGYNDTQGNNIELAILTGSLTGINVGVDPEVATNTVAGKTATSATLQGTLVTLGTETSVFVSFAWGTSTSYTSYTSDQILEEATTFSDSVSLNPSTTYHYAARVRTVGQVGYYFGNDMSFTTDGSAGVINPPVNFKVSSYTSTSITLTWTKGEGAVNTVIRSSTTAYPTTPTSGTSVYNGSASTVTNSALTTDTRYYYSAWSEASGSYSATYVTTSATPITDVLAPPDTLEIETLQIYKDYINVGDQLVVFSYKILWNEGLPATLNPEDFFYVQILEDDALVKQDRIKQWGYVPGSMYISDLSPLEWGEEYTFKIIGTDKFTTAPEVSYSITSSNYIGSNYDYLEAWCLNLATRMQNSIYWDTLVDYEQTQYMLNSSGAQVFLTAIPGLLDKCEDLYLPTGEPPDYVQPDGSLPYSDSLSEQAETSHGTVYWGTFENISTTLGVSTETVAWLFWLALYLIGVVIITMVTHSVAAGAITATPIIIVGTAFGGIPMSVVIGVAIIGIGVFIYKWVFYNA